MSQLEILVVIIGAVLGFMIVRFAQNNMGAFSGDKGAGSPDDDKGRDGLYINTPATNDPTEDDYIRANWYNILGVNEHAAQWQIDDAYGDMKQRYHPDKVRDMGIEVREAAERKTQQIDTAYRYACEARATDQRN